MKSKGLNAAALAVCLVLALAAGVQTTRAANHGDQATPVNPGITVEAVKVEGRSQPVMVYRGELGPRPANPYVEEEQASQVPETTTTQLLGGRTLWIIDRERDAVRGCRLVDSGNVGQRAIRCWSRGLPE